MLLASILATTLTSPCVSDAQKAGHFKKEIAPVSLVGYERLKAGAKTGRQMIFYCAQRSGCSTMMLSTPIEVAEDEELARVNFAKLKAIGPCFDRKVLGFRKTCFGSLRTVFFLHSGRNGHCSQCLVAE